MKEYGGYIEFEYFHGKEYHASALALNSGSHCLEYLIRANNFRKIYIPFLMCCSLKEICERTGVITEYYRTDPQFLPLLDRSDVEQDAVVYIVNYYGQLTNDTVLDLKRQYGNIIVDNAHAFFQMPAAGVDTLYTCRKFFGVADGAYLYTDAVLEEKLECDSSYSRYEFLFGRQELGANAFYNKYIINEDRLFEEPLRRMSPVTQNLLKGLDYHRIRNTRTENFAYLHNLIGSVNKLSLNIPQGAYMYPLYLENGKEIRKTLQMEKIYIPTLWPDVFDVCSENMLEYDLAQNILPLPVDQRYGTDDMHYIAEMVKKYLSN